MPDLFLPIDRGELLKPVTVFPVGVVDDGVYGFTDSGQKYVRTKTGPVHIREAGIYANVAGSQTTRMNIVLANAKVKMLEIEAENGGYLTLSGTVQGQGKELIFRTGMFITGTCTINNAVITAPLGVKIFGPDVTLTNCKTTTPFCDVRWFGARGNGVSIEDDAPFINKAIDTVVKNATMYRQVALGPGKYYIHSPILAENWSAALGKYDWVTFELTGQDSSYFTADALSTIVELTTTDTFALGIQCGKSCVVRGIEFKGQFLPSFPSYANFCRATYANFGAGFEYCREDRYSPYAGIVIDPFGYTLPPTGTGYPGFNAAAPVNYYRGPGGGAQGGSTGVTIKYCKTYGFVVDMMFSPNGTLQNCDSMYVDTCAVEKCKVAFGFGQDQTKSCSITNITMWDTVHTMCDNLRFGNSTTGCPPTIKTVCIAGTVNQLFNINTTGRFGFEADDIYGEAVFRIGTVTGMPSKISNLKFNAATEFPGIGSPDYYFIGDNVKFDTGTMRIYDNLFNKRMHMQAVGCTFDNIRFDQPPLFIPQTNNYKPNQFKNCKVGANGNGLLSTELNLSAVDFSTVTVANAGKIKLELESFDNSKTLLEYEAQDYEKWEIAAISDLTLVVNEVDRTGTIAVANADKHWRINEYLYTNTLAQANGVTLFDDAGALLTYAILGRVSAASPTQLTLSEIPVNITDGIYGHPRTSWVDYLYAPFMGDVTVSSDVITNVEPSDPNGWPAAGQRIETNGYTGIILSVNQGAKTITMDRPSFFYTVNNAVFANGKPKITINTLYPPNHVSYQTSPRAVMTDTEWVLNYEPVPTLNEYKNRKFIFNKGGYVYPAGVAGATRQAEWFEQINVRQNTTTGRFEFQNPTTLVWTEVGGAGVVDPGSVESFAMNANTDLQILPAITVNRILTLPTAVGVAGKIKRIWNRNTSAFTWTLTSVITNPDESTASFIASDSVMTLQSDGTSWVRVDSKPALVRATATDANTTVFSGTDLQTLIDVTAARTLTLPSAVSFPGKTLEIWNKNTHATLNWAFAVAITLPDGTTSTLIPRNYMTRIVSDGTVWVNMMPALVSDRTIGGSGSEADPLYVKGARSYTLTADLPATGLSEGDIAQDEQADKFKVVTAGAWTAQT